jgi:hypothetical protein
MGHVSIVLRYADLFDDELGDIATVLESLDHRFHEGRS